MKRSILQYNEWNGRPLPLFDTSNIDSIPIATDECANDIDIDNMDIDNMDIDNNEDL